MSALAAGAVGSLITLGVAFIALLIRAPREVRSHDRRVDERDASLADWVGDRDVALRRDIGAKHEELADREGEPARQIGRLKQDALHQWRDQERQASNEIGAIYDAEGPLHAAWRWRAGAPQKSLTTPARAEPVLNMWREAPSSLDDPTLRTLDRVVRDAPSRLTEYQ
jgi:hypothetical protein